MPSQRSPEQRALVARIAAHEKWAKTADPAPQAGCRSDAHGPPQDVSTNPPKAAAGRGARTRRSARTRTPKSA